jgi:hypothetical protein
MLETHIMMSSLILRLVLILMFCLALTLVLRLALFHVLCLALLLVLCLSSLMDLTITHMVLVHERTVLCLDALDTAHVLIVVIVSRVVLVSLLEGLTLTLSRDIWTAHAFCDSTTSKMGGLSPKIILGDSRRSENAILDEARMRKHTQISIQYQI